MKGLETALGSVRCRRNLVSEDWPRVRRQWPIRPRIWAKVDARSTSGWLGCHVTAGDRMEKARGTSWPPLRLCSMSTGPTNAVSPDDRADRDEPPPSACGRPQTQHPGATKRTTLQQRLEESRLGRRFISGIIVVIIGTQVVWSMPDSAIRRALMPVVEPANVINVNERWSMFAPAVGTRIDEFEVDVMMADGSSRIWKRKPNSLLEKIFLPDRWPLMTETAMRQQDGRRDFARWVVDQVAGPSDRPVKVVMMFHFRVLAPPGQPSKSAIGTRILYEEVLAGQR